MHLLEQIDRSKHLFLVALAEVGQNSLEIVLEEASADGPEVDVEVAPGVVFNAVPIVATASCRRWRVRFELYVMYAVGNESYSRCLDTDAWSGRVVRVYSKSLFLDYVRSSTYATDDYPGKLMHFGFGCEDHVIDVVTTTTPVVEIDDLRHERPCKGADLRRSASYRR